MITVSIVKANQGYADVNPFRASDRAMLDQAVTVTVTVFGADKVQVLNDVARRLLHFRPAFGYAVTLGEVVSSQEFSITLDSIARGTGFQWAMILTRLAGRQSLIKAELKELSEQPSRIRKSFLTQFLPSTVENGSVLANSQKTETLLNSQGYLDIFDPLFRVYALY
jgi:hypothetical protein